MITTKSQSPGLQVRFTNGKAEALADATLDKGGSGQGFRPHELLEAALATCMNMHLRLFAQANALQLNAVSTTVTLDRGDPDETVFHYCIDLDGPLSESSRQQLVAAAIDCPLRKTLSRRMFFRG